jgi:hypothetical protein
MYARSYRWIARLVVAHGSSVVIYSSCVGQTVIVVDAPGAMMMRGYPRSLAESPYNTRQAIEVVVRALQPRVPR